MLNDAERNYSTTETLCLAALWPVLLLSTYIEGQLFNVRTKHAFLRGILNLSEATGRLGRWRVRLVEYEFEVEPCSGVKQQVADVPSRAPTKNKDTPWLNDKIPCLLLGNEAEEAIIGHFEDYAVAKVSRVDSSS